MAILHKATLTPSKQELVGSWLDGQPWAEPGETTVLGGYRFDDPDGEVGVEALLARRGDQTLQVPMTYRAAELPGGGLIATVEHSVLGRRWVYDASTDPVALGCYVRSLRGEQEQAELEVWDGDTLVERRDPAVRLRREDGAPASDAAGLSVGEYDGQRVGLVHVVGEQYPDAARLVATWRDGEAVVAVLLG